MNLSICLYVYFFIRLIFLSSIIIFFLSHLGLQSTWNLGHIVRGKGHNIFFHVEILWPYTICLEKMVLSPPHFSVVWILSQVTAMHSCFWTHCSKSLVFESVNLHFTYLCFCLWIFSWLFLALCISMWILESTCHFT